MMKYPPKLARAASCPIALAGLCLSLLLAYFSAGAQTPQDPQEEAFRRISNRVMCQCGGCTYTAGSCNHLDCASATYIQKTIRNSLAAGKSEQTILASFVQEYGPRILPEPPREGFTWLGWIMPFVALLLGGGAVSYVLWRWKMEPVPEDPSPSDGGTAGLVLPAAAAGNDLVEKYRAQIDRELEKD